MKTIQPIDVRFLDAPGEDVTELLNDMRLLQIAKYIQATGGDPLPTELEKLLTNLLGVVAEIFSVDLPMLQANPETTLRTVAREINLARLFRERGVFRFYQLLYTHEDGVPWYMKRTNPFTGSPFATQDEFIGWFCSEAKITRATVFMRVAAINRMLALGFSLEDTFRMMVTKAFAIQETVRLLANWGKGGQIESIDPETAARVAARYDPELANEIEGLDQEALQEAIRPSYARLLAEVSDHERARDALYFVRHDILHQPEIKYTWDENGRYFLAQVFVSSTGEDGVRYTSKIHSIPIIIDAPDVPKDLRDDLLKKLQVHNRSQIIDN